MRFITWHIHGSENPLPWHTDWFSTADLGFPVIDDQFHRDVHPLTRWYVLSLTRTGVVSTGPFFKFFPCNHSVNIKKKISFSGEAKDSAIFPFFILLHNRAKPIEVTMTVSAGGPIFCFVVLLKSL
jgi:hypothetical protein